MVSRSLVVCEKDKMEDNKDSQLGIIIVIGFSLLAWGGLFLALYSAIGRCP